MVGFLLFILRTQGFSIRLTSLFFQQHYSPPFTWDCFVTGTVLNENLLCRCFLLPSLVDCVQERHIPYILECSPHPFYSLRGLKNQMLIRFEVESWILEK